MADMLRISSSGSTVRLAQSHEEPAQLQIVIIDALMNSEQPAPVQSILQSGFYCHVHWYHVTYLLVTPTLIAVTFNTSFMARLFIRAIFPRYFLNLAA